MKSKEYINNQIIAKYPTANVEKLAKELGLTLTNLRVKARRLGIRRQFVNDIIDGKKKCPTCGFMKSVGLDGGYNAFRVDCYQKSNLDYMCKSCRSIYEKIDRKDTDCKHSLAFGKGKKQNKVIMHEGKPYLRCKSCDVVLPLSHEYYNIDSKMSHGHRNTCRTCEMLKRRGLI